MKTSTIRCDPTVVMFHGDTLGCIMPESFWILPSSFHFARGPCACSAMCRTCRYWNDWRVLSLFSLASRWAHYGLWRHSVETLRGNTHSERFVFSGNPLELLCSCALFCATGLSCRFASECSLSSRRAYLVKVGSLTIGSHARKNRHGYGCGTVLQLFFRIFLCFPAK